jgi:hypothetical protein
MFSSSPLVRWTGCLVLLRSFFCFRWWFLVGVGLLLSTFVAAAAAESRPPLSSRHRRCHRHLMDAGFMALTSFEATATDAGFNALPFVGVATDMAAAEVSTVTSRTQKAAG